MKQNYFLDSGPDAAFTNKTLIKSISFDQTEILNWIKALYCPDGFDIDITYSKGNFYKGIDKPKFRSDIEFNNSLSFVANSCSLPLKNGSVSSIMYDPPFVGGVPASEGSNKGVIKTRFGFYNQIDKDLWDSYSDTIFDAFRVLKEDGILVMKCQDTILSSKQYLSHVFIINEALKAGFYPEDLFVLLARNVLIGWTNKKNQYHARKFHSYFLVFKKTECKVDYRL